MNLYKAKVTDSKIISGIYGDTVYVYAGSAMAALPKAYKKYEQRNPDCGTMTLQLLELIQENA